jgi:hypothetical protein
MPVFTVPFDYDEMVDRLTVPICISDTDDFGNPVHFGWVERGVAPVADKLVNMAAGELNDKWRASEIAEPAVHKLSRDFGRNLGIDPSSRVLSWARWYAKDLRFGGRRARRKKEVELFAHKLESLQDQVDFVRSIVAKDTLDRLVEQLVEMDMEEVRAMVPMMLRECDAEHYQRAFNKSRNAITQQFYRGMRKAARVAGIISSTSDTE